MFFNRGYTHIRCEAFLFLVSELIPMGFYMSHIFFFIFNSLNMDYVFGGYLINIWFSYCSIEMNMQDQWECYCIFFQRWNERFLSWSEVGPLGKKKLLSEIGVKSKTQEKQIGSQHELVSQHYLQLPVVRRTSTEKNTILVWSIFSKLWIC